MKLFMQMLVKVWKSAIAFFCVALCIESMANGFMFVEFEIATCNYVKSFSIY